MITFKTICAASLVQTARMVKSTSKPDDSVNYVKYGLYAVGMVLLAILGYCLKK